MDYFSQFEKEQKKMDSIVWHIFLGLMAVGGISLVINIFVLIDLLLLRP